MIPEELGAGFFQWRHSRSERERETIITEKKKRESCCERHHCLSRPWLSRQNLRIREAVELKLRILAVEKGEEDLSVWRKT